MAVKFSYSTESIPVLHRRPLYLVSILFDRSASRRTSRCRPRRVPRVRFLEPGSWVGWASAPLSSSFQTFNFRLLTSNLRPFRLPFRRKIVPVLQNTVDEVSHDVGKSVMFARGVFSFQPARLPAYPENSASPIIPTLARRSRNSNHSRTYGMPGVGDVPVSLSDQFAALLSLLFPLPMQKQRGMPPVENVGAPTFLIFPHIFRTFLALSAVRRVARHSLARRSFSRGGHL